MNGTEYVYTAFGWRPVNYYTSKETPIRYADETAQRDELIETQREVIADLQAQLEAIKAHQAEVRAATTRNYCAAIVRMAKYRRLYRAARRELELRGVNK